MLLAADYFPSLDGVIYGIMAVTSQRSDLL